MARHTFQNLRGELLYDYPLARHTSWRVGGPADCCYRPVDLLDLQYFLSQLPSDESITWLGLGSNVLIREAGILGTVIITANRLDAITLITPGCIRAEAGVTCAKLAKFCALHGFEQGAFFAGIPGTVGGALAMNAGAFGGETWQHIQAVEIMDRYGRVSLRPRQDFTVSYREVIIPEGQFFSAGVFYFDSGKADVAKQHIQTILKKRGDSQPIGVYSCGSVFRNPPGDYAARLIEQAGLKGYSSGRASVSTKHANFILNDAHASADELEALVHFIQERVYEYHHILLTPEVRVLGRQRGSS